MLCGQDDNPNIFVVGDDEQSIYRFQGACLENILLFSKKYKKAKLVVLEKNYRSKQNILDVSRKLILNNKNQLIQKLKNVSKNLQSVSKQKGEILLAQFSSGDIENYFLANEIKRLIKEGMSPSEIAVLYRNHSDAKDLIEMLSKLNVPYKLQVGENVLDDSEIKKLVNIFKVLNIGIESVDFSEQLFEIMHYDFFEIEEIDILKLVAFANKKRESLWNVLLDKKTELKLKKPAKIKKLTENLIYLINFSHNHTFVEVFEETINRTGFLEHLINKFDSLHNLNRLETLFSEIKKLNVKDKNLNIAKFLKTLELYKENNLIIKEKELDAKFEGVNLLTAHKAKGLEFEIVFIIHVTDKHWGGKTQRQLIDLPKGLLKIDRIEGDLNEEERRLFYVALTRAKSKIYITFADKYGQNEDESFELPSQFLLEIGENLKNLNIEKYEKDFDKRIKLNLAQETWNPKKNIRDYVKGLLEEFRLSPTSFNTYLNCPKSFFLDDLLKVPKTKNFVQSYGTAVHKALELFFQKQAIDFKVPSKELLLEFFESSLKDEILRQSDYDRALTKGRATLSNYFDFYKSYINSTQPLKTEYNFSKDQVKFEGIPITGRIDKLELIDPLAKTVRVVDYKTSVPKSLNYLSGTTREKDLSYLYQVYFYKLLSESDHLFPWKVKEVQFDFTESSNGKFGKVTVPIDDKAYNDFKTLLKKTYESILGLKFSANFSACKKNRKECRFKDFC